MIRKYFFHIIIFFFTKSLSGQENDFKIITQDAVNFWKAVDSLKAGSDTTQLFQTLVIDKASEEFKVFISKWHIKASHYSYTGVSSQRISALLLATSVLAEILK